MKAYQGQYTRAVEEKGNIVVLLMSEVYGSMHGDAVRYLDSLDAMTGTRDATEYADPPGKRRLSWREHWGRELSAAPVYGDAARVLARRRRVRDAAARAYLSHCAGAW